jgi:hypothetical protein
MVADENQRLLGAQPAIEPVLRPADRCSVEALEWFVED